MEAVGSAALNGLDRCGCRSCGGASLTRFAYLVDRAAGRAHDIAATLQLGAELRRQDFADRPSCWLRHCMHARPHGASLAAPYG